MSSTVFLLFITFETAKVTHTVMDSYSSAPQINASSRTYVFHLSCDDWIFAEMGNPCAVFSLHGFTLLPSSICHSVSLFFSALFTSQGSCLMNAEQLVASTVCLEFIKIQICAFPFSCFLKAGNPKQALFLFPASKFSCFFYLLPCL